MNRQNSWLVYILLFLLLLIIAYYSYDTNRKTSLVLSLLEDLRIEEITYVED